MSITARIAAGLFLLAGLLIGVLTYELSVVDRLQRINEDLSRTNLEAARISVLLLQGVEGVGEFAAKASALRDAEYRRQWVEWEGSFEEGLDRLAAVGLEGDEDSIRDGIEATWSAYGSAAERLWEDPALLPTVDAVLRDLRGRIESLIEVNERTVARRAATSAEAGEEARLVAWVAAAGALALATVASVLLFLSISGPLRRLTSGTRELARGRFEHRLEVSGPAELAALAADFNDMAARLSELEDLKRDFVSHVSHELKTPLAALQETVEIMLERIPGPLTDKQAHLLELSRKSSARLSAMISELLEVSRLEAGAANYRPSRQVLGDIARSVLDEMQPLADEGGLALALDGPDVTTPLLCDGDRIRDVVANLVGNAIKFSPEESAVRVGVTRCGRVPITVPPRHASALAAESGDFLLLSVDDQGRGVPDEHKERIFDKFHQVERGTRIRGQGVGLGLAISRHIVEAHGGAIWVEDRPDGGSSFRVLLPVSPVRWRHLVVETSDDSAEPRDPRPTLTRSRAGAGARALLVALVAAAPLAGCAGRLQSAPPAPPSDAAASPASEPDRNASGPPGRLEPDNARVARAQALLAGSYFEEAAVEFQRILERDPSGAERADALWGTALVHLSAGSPLHDPARGVELLVAVEREFPTSLPGIQARWARLALEQIAVSRRDADEQRALLQQLNEALEALRQIDLDRRPSGARPDPGAPRPDSASGGARLQP